MGVRAIEDHVLIRRIQSGDPAAFETLVNKYYQNIYAFCVRRCGGNTALGADLTQETFLRLVAYIHRYRPTGKFINYLLTIAVNVCKNCDKKSASQPDGLEEAWRQPGGGDIEGDMMRSETALAVQRAIDQLPAPQREAVILRFSHDKKVRELAAITGVGLPTAKSRLKQGLDKLRRSLEQEEWEI